jgi:hypothetical protein
MATKLNSGAESTYWCHPRQMITKKPLNVSDEDLFDGMSRLELPISQPTVMSSLLLKIRVGEISRNIVDRLPLSMARVNGLRLEEVMDIDTELQMLINDIPDYFSMETDALVETFQLTPARAGEIRFQGHLLHCCLYAQRCKLHVPFLKQGFTDPTYSASREICLESARLIIKAQMGLQNSPLCITARHRLAATLLEIFKSCLVLIMDLRAKKSLVPEEGNLAAIADAFRILDEAKNESEAGAKFVDSLMLVMQKHKVPTPKATAIAPLATCNDSIQSALSQQPNCNLLETEIFKQPNGQVYDVPVPKVDGNDSAAGLLQNDSVMAYSHFNELADSVEHGGELGNFDWDHIFLDIESSFV